MRSCHARVGRPQSMSRKSSKPFGEELRALMDAHGTAYRRLAQVIRELDGKGIAHAHINVLANGHDKPSMRAMELIAHACDVDPNYFAGARSSRPCAGWTRRHRRRAWAMASRALRRAPCGGRVRARAASLRGGVVALVPAAKVTIDVERFGCGDDSGYGGELLPDELCEQWALGRRARLRERRLGVLRSRGQWKDVATRTPRRGGPPRAYAPPRGER
jgi:transcriptional regulator with XRE-family HTH domain